MNKKHIIYILIIILVIGAILFIAGMNANLFNKQATNNTANNTTINHTINVTHIDNNSDESSSSGSGQSSGSRYREIRDEEYLGDAVVYEDVYTGKQYYQGQEMDYASLADKYNKEHGVGPYAQN